MGYAILLKSTDSYILYAAIFLTASYAFFGGALSNAQVSANTIYDTARNIAISTNGKIRKTPWMSDQYADTDFAGMLGYLGGLIETWTYLP